MNGRILSEMANVLYDLPLPDFSQFSDPLDAEDEYVLMIEDFATQYEDAAIQSWEFAYPIMQQLNVVNECTIDTIRGLNQYRPSAYPLYKEAMRHTEDLLFSPQTYSLPRVEEVPEDEEGDVEPAEDDPFSAGDTDDPFAE